MSGGSWNYVCHTFSEIASKLLVEKDSKRRALGRHLLLVAEALHDIEWVDSGDYSEGQEIPAIMAVIKPNDVLKECIVEAYELKEKLDNYIKEVQHEGHK